MSSDLAYLLAHLPADIPVTVIGLGSNLIVRDGGVPGVVVRLGRGFSEIAIDGSDLRAGAAVPDVKVARAAQEAGIAGLSFLRGIPGSIGGALRMNGGAYGRETKDALIEARAVDRAGNVHVLSNSDMGFAYRHCGAPDDYIFTRGIVSRRTRRSGGHRGGNGQDHRIRARRRSRSRPAPAAPPSRIRPDKRRGNLSTPPAAAACGSAALRSPRCTPIF